MTTRILVIVMTALLALYLAVVGVLAVRLLTVDDTVVRIMGVALIVLPLIGLWALVAELLFGLRTQKLGAIVQADGDLPADTLPLRPSGRPVRSAADADFPRYRSAVESDPGNWKAWFRLGLAYDACGDRRRARSSVRRAIALHRDAVA
ncbi:tetratricopeptide repeat protein [Marisediminicola senii]|uniref:tetratricopeptide repeat protein n=1 Tax=Marisediminicola senii TaxID=2711233 RepID=UPI0013E9DA7C|nr:tetratricopeptide repeat protein [Marisediminicola senii]